jgi:DNA-binding LacI/PurR family transcriptional regulator
MSQGRHVGIRDVARTAGVSITTVSHALNDKPGVSNATREHVRQVADSMGYRPDPRGRQLASGRTGLIALTVSLPGGVTMPVAEFAHNAAVVDGAIAAATTRELALVIVPSGGGMIWQRLPIDGAIVVDPSPGDPAIDELARTRVPVVTIGRFTDPDVAVAPVHVVDNDYAQGTRSILDHLLESGAGRIGVVSAGGRESYVQDSLAGYRAWCRETEREPWIFEIERIDWNDIELAVAAGVAACLDRDDLPDALHCVDEVVAVSILAECRARGIAVPGDLLVSSISDRGLAERTSPTLTTLELHPRELGAAAADVLADLVRGVMTGPDSVIVESTVIVRESTSRGVAN